MKATIDTDGYLKIECGSVIESLSVDDLRAFAKYAVFQEHLLRGVIDSLVSGQMWRDDEEPAWWFDAETTNKLRMRVLELLPEITVAAVMHIEQERRAAEADARQWQDACWNLERNWRESLYPPEYRYEHKSPPPMTKEQAAEYLRTVEKKIGGAP